MLDVENIGKIIWETIGPGWVDPVEQLQHSFVSKGSAKLAPFRPWPIAKNSSRSLKIYLLEREPP